MHDYMAHVERAIRDRIGPEAMLIAVIDDDIVSEREGYWERSYIVAWTKGGPDDDYRYNSGTNRVNINNSGDFMVISGHYRMDASTAKRDAIDRAGLVSA